VGEQPIRGRSEQLHELGKTFGTYCGRKLKILIPECNNDFTARRGSDIIYYTAIGLGNDDVWQE
jgi:hypothetical protein